MKFTKLTLAITFVVASAFLCACDDSGSSAKDEASENNATPAQTQTPSDVFSKHEEYSYVLVFGEVCSWGPAINDIQYDFGPGRSVTMTMISPDGKTTITGMYQKTKDEDGEEYYMIQLKDSYLTYEYYPDDAITFTKDNTLYVYAKDKKDIEMFTALNCAE